MKIRCIVIDDEPLAREKLEMFIGKIGYLAHVKSFPDAISALTFVQTNPVDLIFLDIQTGDFNGISFLASIGRQPKVIIASAYGEYAVQGFDFRVSDYLLKPFSFERFALAVGKVHSELQSESEKNRSYAFFKIENRIEKVDFSDILYVEGQKDYLQIVTKKSKLMTLLSFAEMSEILPKDFVRVHKSYIVCLSCIDSIEKNLIKIGIKAIPIGPTYRDALLEAISPITR